MSIVDSKVTSMELKEVEEKGEEGKTQYEGMVHSSASSSTVSLELEFNRSKENVKLEDQPLEGFRFYTLIVGLFLVIFISFLDHSILATALVIIASEFNALTSISWLPASYMLTATALIPLYGKLSDIFGRKGTIMTALFIFLVGSILCATSTSMIMLIASRALAGVGGGGLIALVIIIISDIVPLVQRSLYLSLTGIFFISASVSGPFVGGLIADTIGWRFNFYLNLPIAVIAIAILFFILDLPKTKQSFKEKFLRIDFAGSIMIILFTVTLLLGLNWGGNEYPWNSWQVILPICISGISLMLFVLIESKIAIEPILPGALFVRNVISANITNLLMGFPLYLAVNYVPLYYQVVKSKSATASAVELLPIVITLVVTSALAGIYTSITGKYRVFNWLGTGMQLIGVGLVGLWRPDVTKVEEILPLLLIGSGYGLCTQNNTILSQAAVKKEDVASVTSLLNFTANLGGVLGLAILGSVFNNVLKVYLSEQLPEFDLDTLTSSVHIASILSEEDLVAYKLAYLYALRFAFLAATPFCSISFISSLFLVHIPIVNKEDDI